MRTGPAADHLVYAAPDLGRGVAHVRSLLGVDVVPGGSHPGMGTRNALVSLGRDVYLEVIGADPEGAAPPAGRPFGIDQLAGPRLVTWAVRTTDIDRDAARAREAGIDLGEVTSMRRLRPDGRALSWRLTDPYAERAGGALPFLIDWGDSDHPAAALPAACRLLALVIVHPDPAGVRSQLARLGLDHPVEAGIIAGLRARIETPTGVVELG